MSDIDPTKLMESVRNRKHIEKKCKNCKWCERIERNNGWVQWRCVRFPDWVELLCSRSQTINGVNHYCGEFKERDGE